jgi:hypothetical protein
MNIVVDKKRALVKWTLPYPQAERDQWIEEYIQGVENNIKIEKALKRLEKLKVL